MDNTSQSALDAQARCEIKGTCGIEEAARVRAILVESLSQADRAALDLSKATDADLSFLQLLCAAHKSAVRRGKTLTITGAVPEDIRQKAREAGMTGNRSCGSDLSGSCLWAEV
jgi:anti-anti-sigma regulatory factor